MPNRLNERKSLRLLNDHFDRGVWLAVLGPLAGGLLTVIVTPLAPLTKPTAATRRTPR